MTRVTKAQRANNEARQRLVEALGWPPEDQTLASERYAYRTDELTDEVARIFGREHANKLRSGE